MVKPMGNRVVVKQKESETKTEGGIYLPENTIQKSKEGVITAIGALVSIVNIGDTILFNLFAGTEITVDKQKYLLICEEDILAVVEDK